jgi:ADP-heptose:LPS heptosyltransferase
MIEQAPALRRILLLQCRNYGDAVIGTGLAEALGGAGQGVELHVLTRPRFRELYAHNPHVAAVHEAEFPMGTAKSFGAAQLLPLLRQVAALRRLRFERVVNLCGDARENLLGWLIAPRGNCGPVWPDGHPHRKLVRQGLCRLLGVPVAMVQEETGMYAMVERFARALGAGAPARQRVYDRAGLAYRHRGGARLIGLHPAAGLACKEWPAQRWRALAQALRQEGWGLRVFGAPGERPRLEADFAGLLGPGLELATGGLDEFFLGLTGLSAYVGLDSFGIHAAHAVGTPAVLLNGGILAPLIRPPGTALVDGGAGMPCHPCYYRPSCTAQASPYGCIRALPEQSVLRELRGLLPAADDSAAAHKL